MVSNGLCSILGRCRVDRMPYDWVLGIIVGWMVSLNGCETSSCARTCVRRRGGKKWGAEGGSWRRKAGEGQVYDDAIYCLRSVWDLWFRLFYFLDT